VKKNMEKTVPVSVSARHIHLSRNDIDSLFGNGYELTVFADLSQPGQYACNETLEISGPRGSIENVRILGPERPASQVEISKTDCYKLGVSAPVRNSGDTAGTPGITLKGPAGTIELSEGVIQAKRHIHMSPEEAARYGVTDRQWVMVRLGGDRGIIFDDVLVRVSPKYRLDMHIDTDEANAAGIKTGDRGTLLSGETAVKAEPDD
jgi:putative phosphotransacetylase